MTSYTKQELIDKLPVMTAWTQGKQVQFKGTFPSNKDKWIDTPNPSWDSDLEYRIKPEVVKVASYAVVSVGTGNIAALYALEYDAVCVKNSYRDSDNWTVVKLEGTYER